MNKIDILKYSVEQLICQGNLDVINSCFSENYIAHSGNKTYKGHKFIQQFTTQIRKAIPDIKIVKIEMLANTDSVVTWQRTFTGTHKLQMKGIPASNKNVKWYEIVVSRFENDKIIEEWISSDLGFQLICLNK